MPTVYASATVFMFLPISFRERRRPNIGTSVVVSAITVIRTGLTSTKLLRIVPKKQVSNGVGCKIKENHIYGHTDDYVKYTALLALADVDRENIAIGENRNDSDDGTHYCVTRNLRGQIEICRKFILKIS